MSATVMSGDQPSHRKTNFKRLAVLLIKLLIGVGIFAFLISRLDRESLEKLSSGPKRFDFMFIAFLWVLIAHLITYIRWWQLVRSLGVAFPLKIALRVGFLGSAFNLVSFGAVGGDLFKAVVAARSAPKKIPEVIASIIADRIVGLIGLILVTCIAIELFVGMGAGTATGVVELPASMKLLRQYVWLASIASVVGIIVLVAFGKHLPAHLFSRLPIVGGMSSRMAAAAHQFHGRPFLMMLQIGSSCAVHLSLTLGFYMLSRSLSTDAPSLLMHLITVPPSFAVAALPIMPGGAGVFELAVTEFMEAILGEDAPFMKIVVAVSFAYRLLLLLIAAIGGFYYIMGFGKLAADEDKVLAQLTNE